MATATLTYGSIYFSTPVETVLDAATPLKALGTTTTMQLEGFSHPTNNRLQCTSAVARMYEVRFDGSVSKTAGGGTVATFSLRKSGNVVDGAFVVRTISSSADKGAFPVVGFISLVSPEYVELWIESAGGDDLQVDAGVLSAQVLG